MNRLTEQLGMETKIDTTSGITYDFYQDFRYSFMYTIFKNHEMELLISIRLPKEVITNHHMIDDRWLKKLYLESTLEKMYR